MHAIMSKAYFKYLCFSFGIWAGLPGQPTISCYVWEELHAQGHYYTHSLHQVSHELALGLQYNYSHWYWTQDALSIYF